MLKLQSYLPNDRTVRKGPYTVLKLRGYAVYLIQDISLPGNNIFHKLGGII